MRISQLNPCSCQLPPMPVPPPSFSSFPPSFSSYPDLGGSVRKEQETESLITAPAQRRDSKLKDRGDRKKRRRDKRSGLDQIPSHERRNGSLDPQGNFDDERLKSEEDVARRTGQQDVSPPTFFSDKKGDPLSMQYGGNYSRDIPKYHLLGRESKPALLYLYGY